VEVSFGQQQFRMVGVAFSGAQKPRNHRHATCPTLSGKSGEVRSRFGRCTVAGVEVWMAQPLAVVIVSADPAALIDSVVPACLNCTTCVGGLVNR
jgi:hypothetical protein